MSEEKNISGVSKITKIPTSLGLLSLDDLFERKQKFDILSESGTKVCDGILDVGDLESKILILKSGRCVECTLNHEFRVVRDGKKEWVKASDLNIHDRLLMSRRNSSFGDFKVNIDEAYSWGTDGNSYEVPYQILRAPKDVVASYLKGIFNRKCSRCFNESRVMLSLLSIEREFAYDIGSLLSMFGANYRIVEYVLEKSSLFEVISDDNISLAICDIAIFKRQPRVEMKTINILFEDELIDIHDSKCHMMKPVIDDSYCFDGFVCR